MLLRTRRKAGFTLIELLVVMGIIAILLALLLPAVQRSRVRRDQTENYHRMQKLATAIAGLKEPSNGLNLSYVPSVPINITVAPGAPGAPVGFALKGQYRGDEPEVFILKRAWPNMNTQMSPNPQNGVTNNGYTGPDLVLDANQTLVLFLTGGGATGGTGFSTDPRRPFLTGGSRKGPYLEFNTTYIVNGPTLNGQQAPWVVDPFGTPYAYFAAVDGRSGAYAGSITVNGQTIYPLTRGGKFIKEDSFQIISAGYDKVFGNTAAPSSALPLTGSPGGMDDQGHFQESILGSN